MKWLSRVRRGARREYLPLPRLDTDLCLELHFWKLGEDEIPLSTLDYTDQGDLINANTQFSHREAFYTHGDDIVGIDCGEVLRVKVLRVP